MGSIWTWNPTPTYGFPLLDVGNRNEQKNDPLDSSQNKAFVEKENDVGKNRLDSIAILHEIATWESQILKFVFWFSSPNSQLTVGKKSREWVEFKTHSHVAVPILWM